MGQHRTLSGIFKIDTSVSHHRADHSLLSEITSDIKTGHDTEVHAYGFDSIIVDTTNSHKGQRVRKHAARGLNVSNLWHLPTQEITR